MTGSGTIRVSSDAYVNNMRCYWLLLAPPGSYVRVRFTFFSVRRRTLGRLCAPAPRKPDVVLRDTLCSME